MIEPAEMNGNVGSQPEMEDEAQEGLRMTAGHPTCVDVYDVKEVEGEQDRAEAHVSKPTSEEKKDGEREEQVGNEPEGGGEEGLDGLVEENGNSLEAEDGVDV